MIVAKTFTAICNGCNQPITLRTYEHLDGLYGDHHCPGQSAILMEDGDLYRDLQEQREGPEGEKGEDQP